MKKFINNELKLFIIVISLLSIVIMILGTITIKKATIDYKTTMIKHDYEIAGYLIKNGVDPSLVINSFTTTENKVYKNTGEKFLQNAGYNTTVENKLLPDIYEFYQKYTMIIIVILFIFFISIIIVAVFLASNYLNKIEEADIKLRSFMEGNYNIRLKDYDEGTLSKLFTTINQMATSLVAHIKKEKQNKEFLRDTISDISHQIKTPLAALKMYNEIIQNEETQNSVVDDFSIKSEREILRIEMLVLNLLKLAKLDVGSIKLEMSKLNVRTFLEEVINSFSTRAKMEEKELILNCDEELFMNFDSEWLMEAIGNIIKNALDHTSSKDKIEVSCFKAYTSILITIKDNGVGIHPEDIHHIFKRFYRSRFSKEKQGVGIGLAISKSIIEKHGGTITVNSELGKGTEFTIIFPNLSKL